MTRAEIFEIIEDLAGVSPGTVQGDEVLVGLGEWDSLAGTEFRTAIAEEHGIKLSGVDMEPVQTVADILVLLQPHTDG